MSWLFGKKDKQGDKPDDGAKGASAASADAAPPKVRLKSISIEQVSPGPVILCGLGTSYLLPPSFCLLPSADEYSPRTHLLHRNLRTEFRRIRAVWPTIPSRRSLVSAPAAGPSNCERETEREREREGFRPPRCHWTTTSGPCLPCLVWFSDGDDHAFVAGTASLGRRRRGGTMSPSGSTNYSSSSTRSAPGTDHPHSGTLVAPIVLCPPNP